MPSQDLESTQKALVDAIQPRFTTEVNIGVPCLYKSLSPSERAINTDCKTTFSMQATYDSEADTKHVDICHQGYLHLFAQTGTKAEVAEAVLKAPLRYGVYVVAYNRPSASSSKRR